MGFVLMNIKTLLLILCMTFIAQSSSSDDSSISSDDSSSLEVASISFDGEFSISSQLSLSICTRSDGNIYMAAHRIFGGDAIFDYVYLVGRSTEGIESEDGVYETELDAHMFNVEVIGVTQTDAKLRYNPTTNEYSLVINDEINILTKTSDSAQRECFMASQTPNWDEISTPFYAVSQDLGSICQDLGVDACIEVDRITDTAEDGGGYACFGWYDTANEQFIGGGDLSVTVDIVWDGELRINDWTDLLLTGEECGTGSEFAVFNSEGSYNIAWKCSGVESGAVYPLSVPCVACESFGECPLYNMYDVVYAGSILENNINDDNEGSYHGTVVINLSNATIGNLWAVLIVFIFVTAALCWWQSRKGNFIKK